MNGVEGETIGSGNGLGNLIIGKKCYFFLRNLARRIRVFTKAKRSHPARIGFRSLNNAVCFYIRVFHDVGAL